MCVCVCVCVYSRYIFWKNVVLEHALYVVLEHALSWAYKFKKKKALPLIRKIRKSCPH